MVRIPKWFRSRKPTKRMDTTNLREITKDRRCWACMGVVAEVDGRPHFEIIEEGGKVEVLIEVETQPLQNPITCRLGSAAGGQSRGVWAIPPVGSEVAILVPNGKVDWQPTIVAVLSSGGVPGEVTENVTVIANSEVLIYDGETGTTDQLVKKSAYEVHVHGTGTGPSTAADNATDPASYTTILKAQ